MSDFLRFVATVGVIMAADLAVLGLTWGVFVTVAYLDSIERWVRARFH